MYRNIKINYKYTFFQNLVVTSLWVLYLSRKGFGPIEIGVMEALFHGTSFIFEVPSGSMGDRFGYRNVLIASRVVGILSCFLIMMSGSFLGVTAGFMFSALSYNLASGTNEALVFESLKADKKEYRYIQVSANISVLMEFAISAGVVIAGLMSDWFFDGVYWIQIGLNIIAIFYACQFTEPKRFAFKQQKYFALMRSAFQSAKSIPGLLVVMLCFAFLDSVNATYYFYFQNFFAELGIAGLGISLVIVVSSVFQIIGAKLAPVIEKRFSMDRLFLICLGLLVFAVGLSGFLPRVLVILCFILANTLTALLTPIRSNFINQLIPSEERATINSIDSLCYSLMMIPIFPIAGVLVHYLSYGLTFAVLSVVLVFGGALGYGYMKRSFAKKNPEPAEEE